METLAAGGNSPAKEGLFHRELNILSGLKSWITEQEPRWEAARITISGVGIFIQVTVAGIMIGVLSALGAPPLAYSIGILFAFLGDSIAFGQAPMRWVLGLFAASVAVNALLTLYYAAQYLIH